MVSSASGASAGELKPGFGLLSSLEMLEAADKTPSSRGAG